MDQAEAQIYVGQRLAGRYVISGFIGSGAFSGVFEAYDEQKGVPVAVKILSIQAAQAAGARVEFDGELELLSALVKSSNVVSLIDSGRHLMTLSANGINFQVDVHFLVLELADGSLALLLLNRHQLAWGDRLALFREVTKGIHQMHLQRMVHRDAKADNALVFSRAPIAKISDLGRSCHTEQPRRFSVDEYVAGRGDLRFAAPELLFGCGSADPLAMAQVDLYLVGSLLFEIGTGVAITSSVIGNPRQLAARLVQLPQAARTAEFNGRISELRQSYAAAWEIFRHELPQHLRNPTTDLLKLLTDPDPTRRTPPLRRRSVDPWDLGWLLNRIDVLRKIDAYYHSQLAKRERKAIRKAGRR